MDKTFPIDSFERQKKYQALAEIAKLLHSRMPVRNLCDSICKTINKSLRDPEKTKTRIKIGSCLSDEYENCETEWKISQSFTTPDNLPALIEICFLSEKEWIEEAAHLKETKSFLDNISILISGSITIEDFEALLLDNIERNKELSGIGRVNQILKKNESYEILLQEICQALPASWKHPECAEARLTYDKMVFTTPNFTVTPWVQSQQFEVPGGAKGSIEISYLEEFPQEDEGPFLKEERSLLSNIAHLIGVALGCKIHDQIVYQNRERLKELKAINETTAIIMKGKPIKDTLQSICNVLPESWQYPEHAVARITFENHEYISKPFTETPYFQREQFVTIDNQSGSIEVYYLTELPESAEGPFLKEERDLLCNIARLVAHFINNEKGRRILNSTSHKAINDKKNSKPDSSISDACEFLVYNESKTINIVRNILVVSSVQDAYLLAAETYDFKQITDPLHSNNTWYIPNFRFSSTLQHAELQLESNHFDIVFIIASSAKQDLNSIYKSLKSNHYETQFYLITKSPEQLTGIRSLFKQEGQYKTSVFTYKDDPRFIIFLCKLHEDFLNSELIDAPSILLIDDSPEYYTPVILSFYNMIFSKLQSGKYTQNTRMRLFLTCNYEDSVHAFHLHSRTLTGIFSDVEFDRNGSLQSDSGFELYDAIRDSSANINFILHSTDESYRPIADQKKISFLHKDSSSFSRKICEYVDQMQTLHLCLNTGEYSFRNYASFLEILPSLNQTEALNLSENTNFLVWLKVQGRFDNIKGILNTNKYSHSPSDLCLQIKQTLNVSGKKTFCPPLVNLNSKDRFSEKVITTVSSGSLGGKGRNIAFLHSLLSDSSIVNIDSNIRITIPATLIIRSDEFAKILENELVTQAIKHGDFKDIQNAFDKTELSKDIVSALTEFLKDVDTPLAARSSSLFEDSATRPFAGTFETYILPNNHKDLTVRLSQLIKAIKCIYASPFKPEARLYYSYTGIKPEDDRMAIVLQKLVGSRHGSYYYPQISGVAESYNFYPVGHMNANDGVAVIALGLGYYVVEGRGGHRFSPEYPDIDFGSTEDLIKGSQSQFYAVDLQREMLDFNTSGEKAALEFLDIEEARQHDTLSHCASVYDYSNDRITPDISVSGPVIIDFADILKYDYLPLAKTLKNILSKLSSSMGSPVEIEFAINSCNRNVGTPVFNLLQVRALTGEKQGHTIDIKSIDMQKCLLYSQTSLGDGIIDNITDIVILNSENFDSSKTNEMVKEVEFFNRLQMTNGRSYIIIGPGRWGTRDKSLGIPVSWSQISYAKVVVETAMKNFPLDASLGSHFFHNITVMKTGYVAIDNIKKDEFINWDAFNNMQCVKSLKYFKLLKAEKPLVVQLDGKNRIAVITKE